MGVAKGVGARDDAEAPLLVLKGQGPGRQMQGYLEKGIQTLMRPVCLIITMIKWFGPVGCQ